MTNIKIKSAWNNIRRSPFQTLSVIFVLAQTFFVATLLSMILYSSNNVLKYFETRPQIIAFLKDEATNEQVKKLEEQLLNDSRVDKVRFVSKEDALEIYKKATEDNPMLSELVSPSIFPASLEFSVNDLMFAENVVNDVKGSEIVEEIGFTASLGGEKTLTEVVGRLRNVVNYIRIGGLSFVGFMLATSLIVLIVIISMKMTTKRIEVEILNLIGASAGFIRGPIIIEAFLYALFGVLLGWITALLLVLYASPALIKYFGEIPVLPNNTLELFIVMGIIFLCEFLMGLFISFLGSYIAVSRAQKRKK